MGRRSPEARQLIAASPFEATSALGWRSFRYRWTPHAIRRGPGDVIPGELHLTDNEMVLVGARGAAPSCLTQRRRAHCCVSPRLDREGDEHGALKSPCVRALR